MNAFPNPYPNRPRWAAGALANPANPAINIAIMANSMSGRSVPASVGGSDVTNRVTRGVCRMLAERGYGTLTEFRLASGRRVDVIGLNEVGEFVIVEIKSTVEDFRSDRKWREYLTFCERFFFAVPDGFPEALLPEDCGLIVADGFDAAIRRPAPELAVNGTRKRRQLVRFALAASTRLQRAYEPGW
jgi:hypothetical protein